MFKIEDVISERVGKFSNVFNTETLPFLLEKCGKLLQCKSSSQFFSKNIITFIFVGSITLNDFVSMILSS